LLKDIDNLTVDKSPGFIPLLPRGLMTNFAIRRTLLILSALAALIPLSYANSAQGDTTVDLDNDEMDVTLFRGAANNSYFAVYFNALPEGAGFESDHLRSPESGAVASDVW
jgi:hypothetical protein